MAKQLTGIGIGVLIACAIIAVYIFGMKSAGKSLSKQWEENAGYPAVDASRGKKKPTTYPEIRVTCKARSDAADLSRSQRHALDMLRNVVVGETELARFAVYLDCLMTQPPARLCQAEHKEHLINTVHDYFKLRVKVKEEWFISTASPLSAARTVGIPNNEGSTSSFPSTYVDPRVIAGLKSLITDGYLSRKDIGGFLDLSMPRELQEPLKGVEAKKKSCA